MKSPETLKGNFANSEYCDFHSQKFLPHCYREINYMTRNRKSSLGQTRGFVQASKLQKNWSRLSLM
ncbi:UNVERIFIED_CONTAM: hypothetical protein NCL1_42846 [Trichonephila clavipes]